MSSKKRLAEMAEYMEACALIARNGADIHNGSKELREHADMVTAIASYLSSAVETDWKHRAEEAERILQDNMALANRTTRRTMDERNGIIRKLRERYSAIEIADMVGLTRQRVHQILNEEPVEGSVHGSPAERPAHPDPTGTTREPPHCPTCACGAPAAALKALPVVEILGDDAAALRRYIVEQLGFLSDDDNCPAERFIRLAVAKLRAPETKAEYESVGWQYKFPSIWGGHVWRDSPNRYNGCDYSESREIFAKRLPEKASAPTTCDTKCFGWPRCECGRRMP
jgi:hypothetical protein